MALIKCPECGKEISDKADFCPNCGCPKSEFEASVQENSATCARCGKTLIDANRYYCDECRDIIKKSEQKNNEVTFNNRITPSLARQKRILNTVRWIFAAFIFFLALTLFFSYGISGFFTFALLSLCGVFVSPLSNKLPEVFPIFLRVLLPILFFFAAVAATPSRDTQNTANINNIESEVSVTETESESHVQEPESLIDGAEEESQSKQQVSEIPVTEEIKDDAIIYVDVFDSDLKENWSKYVGKHIRTSFEVGNCEDDYIVSSYEGGYFKVYPDNYRNFEYGDYIVVSGIISGKEGSYIEIINAHIEESGSEAISIYNKGLTAYNAQKEVEAEEYEASFKETAVSPTYEDLTRYPDTYKNTAIKIKVKITDVEPDGIILPGHYEAVMSGSSNKLAVYDDREIKEPKLVKGDTVIIYGYGDGLTTIKIQDTSKIIPKTVEKYTIPGINIKYIEFP